ncbi:IPT/TIG domain-containing protein [Intrasporangium oryzae]|nr:IPT/TIG domain-containing protein [Intrasporangium oryzae]
MTTAALTQLGIPAASAAAPPSSGAAPSAVAPLATGDPGSITLSVKSARSVNPAVAGLPKEGDAVTAYRWMINVDDTGDPGTASSPGYDRCLPARAPGGSSDPGYADTCPWPSVRTTSGHSAIVAQGDESDLSTAKALGNLPPGKYLISVLADGYKIDGEHFTVASGAVTKVTVEMQPTPLPLATIRIQVFNDNAPVDGTYEIGGEQGLSGFTANLSDVLGPVTTDYFGNALCTVYKHANTNGTGPILYDSAGKPIVDTTKSTGFCTSDATGQIVIPNLGPNRYGATVSPPKPVAGQAYQWVQTTTLEGGHDHDIWIQEGDTGYDSELTKGAEKVPAVQFGFVATKSLTVPTTNPPTGEVKGVVVGGLPYIGGQNGQVVPETGFAGAKSDGPIARPWVALSDLSRGDAAVYVGRGAANGSFDITNVPDGTYQLTVWDDAQDYILWSFNVEVANGDVTDVGNTMIVGWFTHITGTVFIDDNGNGKRDPGEQPVPGFTLTVRERDNSLMDQYTNLTTTNDQGLYDIREGYPLGKWLVLEAFNTRYRTTGVTYQAANEPDETTQLGGLVDIDFLPIIGLRGRIDWGVEPYASGQNGGIAATVSYDVTRNEYDPRYAVSEDYQPGIPDVPVHLNATMPCTATTDAEKANSCKNGHAIVPLQVPDPNDPTGATMVDNPDPERGAFVKGPEVNTAYTSEEWAAPRGCTARQYNGQPLTDQLALPEFGTDANRLCVEAPMMGVTVGASDAPGGAQTVNGNYGFATSTINLWPPTDTVHNPDGLALYAPLGKDADGNQIEQDLRAQDYVVSVEIPTDPVDGKPMYQVTREEDVNVFDGDTYLPQENFPPASVSAAEGGAGAPAPKPDQPPSQGAGLIPPCAGALHTVSVPQGAFLDGGGSPFEGQDRPLCDAKLVTVRDGQAVAPNFNLHTPVPLPTHFWGLTINDLGLSLDKRSANFGEAQGLPFVPMGLYDWSGRLVDTVHTDFNGFYEALEPSTGTYNCPVPAGPCPNMYRFVGNDPGQPGALNADYNPRFRTIGTNFQGWPGLYTVTDTAPTQAASTVLAPGTTAVNPTMCDLGATVPQLLAVNRPYVRSGDVNRTVVVDGFGFGATQGSGSVRVGGALVTATAWSDTSISVTLPNTAAFRGSLRVQITNNAGRSSANGLTVWGLDDAVRSGSGPTNPRLAEVGPGKAYPTVQAALEAATPSTSSTQRYWLVVVWPNAQTSANPRGEYNENVIVHHQVAIQGVGPGGFRPDKTFVRGSILDGQGFNPDFDNGAAWIALLGSLRYSGPAAVPDGAVVTVLDDPDRAGIVPSSFPAIDGLQITGGSQADFPANVNTLGGAVKTPYGAAGALVSQGGGVYVHYNVNGLRISDDLIVGNSGSYGGGIRVGTPYVTGGDNRNRNVVISDNQIRDNGGTNLAGGIGLFAGTDGYLVTRNAICGNFSAEYGGAMTVYGYQSHNGLSGTISANTIWFNSSYDEGGAVMLAGELPSDPSQLSEGTGPATIDGNTIVANLASDDGGGIRLLQVSGSHLAKNRLETIRITNNTIADNVSAHEGGGIALDDAAFVEIVNNTVAKNLTTATAITSDGRPAPAGLATGENSDPLQARLRTFSGAAVLGATTYSKPTLLNDVFWDNRAGSFDGGYVYGIGGTLPNGTAGGILNWDMGVSGGGSLHPVNSVIQTTQGTDGGAATTVTDAPGLKDPFDVSVSVLASRTYPAFRQAAIIAELLPPALQGDYHLTGSTSPAYGRGAASTSVVWGTNFTQTVTAPALDIDGQSRPSGTRWDASSDQVKP